MQPLSRNPAKKKRSPENSLVIQRSWIGRIMSAGAENSLDKYRFKRGFSWMSSANAYTPHQYLASVGDIFQLHAVFAHFLSDGCFCGIKNFPRIYNDLASWSCGVFFSPLLVLNTSCLHNVLEGACLNHARSNARPSLFLAPELPTLHRLAQPGFGGNCKQETMIFFLLSNYYRDSWQVA